MASLLSGIAGNSRVQQILICWTTPLLIVSYAFVIVVFPDVRHAAAVSSVTTAVTALHVNKFLFVFFASLAAGVFLQVNRLPLWRLLEGYAWPGFLRRWRIVRAHIPQCRWLQASLEYERAEFKLRKAEDELAKAKANRAGCKQIKTLQQAVNERRKATSRWLQARDAADEWRLTRDRTRKNAKILSRLPRRRQPLFTFGRPATAMPGQWVLPYPAVSDELLALPGSREYSPDGVGTRIMPTLLGNAMRVMETYGANTYGLDSQTMWYELLSVSPESMHASLEQAQVEADTLVCGIYAMTALACSAIAGGAWQAANGTGDAKLWVTAAVSVIVVRVLNRRLLNLVDEWASLVKALVNGAREPLREKYGLRAPISAEDEKRMWQVLTANRWYGPHNGQFDEVARYKQPASRRSWRRTQ